MLPALDPPHFRELSESKNEQSEQGLSNYSMRIFLSATVSFFTVSPMFPSQMRWNNGLLDFAMAH